MPRKPARGDAKAAKASPADQAFGAACAFVEHLATLAYHARHFQPRPDKPDAWQDLAMTYAMAFVAWFDLTHLLTPAVRAEARRVYPPGSPAIKLGGAKPAPTVIEAVADELGVYFRNTVYAGRRHPLEPDRERVADEARARATARQVAQGKPAEPFGWGADFDELMKRETRAAVRERLGIKTLDDGWMLMADEWKKQDRERGESALSLLRCGSIDFDDLRTQLMREAEAVIAAASKPNAPTIDPAILARLEAGIAAVHSIGSNFDAGMARVGQAIESLGVRDDDDGDTKRSALPAGGGESTGPALTENQSRVLRTMALFDASQLLSSKKIAEEMDAMVRLSEETVRQCVGKLIEENLAERPEGDRSGARLTMAGRKLAGKIAD
jgi:hypothetical protein